MGRLVSDSIFTTKVILVVFKKQSKKGLGTKNGRIKKQFEYKS
jgi:hypothetical protein